MTDKQAAVASFAKKVVYQIFEQDNDLDLQVYLTDKCDLSCSGCYMQCNGAPSIVPNADILKIVNELNKQQNYSRKVCITGGEARMVGTKNLKGILQSVMDINNTVELKTNAKWVQNKKESDEMYNMLAGLKVKQYITYVNEADMGNYVKFLKSDKSLPTDETQRNAEVRKRFYEKYPLIPGLSMGISVDNFIHPVQSAKWFKKLAGTVTTDAALYNNVKLGVSTFKNSMDWFRKEIFHDTELNCTDISETAHRFNFKVNNQEIIGLQGTFVDTTKAKELDDMWKISYTDSETQISHMILYVYPDCTIGFETHGLKSVGRVPYLTKSGKIKDLNTLLNDMLVKIVVEFDELVHSGR